MLSRLSNAVLGYFVNVNSVGGSDRNSSSSSDQNDNQNENQNEQEREEGSENESDNNSNSVPNPNPFPPPNPNPPLPPFPPPPLPNDLPPYRRPIEPPPFVNADIGTINLENFNEMSDLEYDSDSDPLAEAANNGNLSADVLVKEICRMNKSLRNMRRVEHSKLHADNLVHCPRPSFPPETANFRYKSMGSSEDFKIIEFNFPRVKFSGNPKTKKAFDMDVYEFLSIMVEGQKHCPVSKSDFSRLLLARLAPPALGMVKGWMLDPNCTINKICNRLFKTFGSPISPRDAKDYIRKYSIPKSLTFDQVLSEFQYLADYAGRGDRDNRENALASVYAVMDGLENSLPEQAYTICYEQILDLRRYYGREPYLGELLDSLRQVTDKVDRVLKLTKSHHWGKARDFLDFEFKKKNPTQSSFQGTSKSNKNKGYGVNETKVQVNEANSKGFSGKGKGQSNQQPTAKGKGQGKGSFKGNFSGPSGQQAQQKQKPQKVDTASGAKKYCCFCGANTHNAADGCWLILDDNMKPYTGPPAQDSCRICIGKKVKKELKHPERVCPLRDKMLALYKAKWVQPKGYVKAVLEGKDEGK